LILKEAEIWILISLLLAGGILAFLFFAKRKDSPSKFNSEDKRPNPWETDGVWRPKNIGSQNSGKHFGGTSTLWDTIFSSKPEDDSIKNDLGKNTGKGRPDQDSNVLEVFDYNGIKILHENGKWTVNDGGPIQTYGDWVRLPPRFQKMVKELDTRSLQNQKSQDYFLEILNGFYYVSMPGGKKKKYKSFHDIPIDIRKFLGKS
jgi:hypothetical protein